MDPEEQVDDGREIIQREMVSVEEQIAACAAQASALGVLLEPVLRPVEHGPLTEAPCEGTSPLATWLCKQTNSVLKVRVFIAQLIEACEL